MRQSPPTRGIIFLPHLANVCCVTSSSDDQSWASFSGYICLKSAAWHVLQWGVFFSFYAKFGQHQLLDMQLSSVIVHFLNAYSISVIANTTYMTSFPKRPDITGAPDQVFKFNNFLDCLIGGIKANTTSAIGTINLGSLCNQFLYAPQIHFNLAGEPIAFIENSSNKWESSVWSILALRPFVSFLISRIRQLWMTVSTMEITCPRNYYPKSIRKISKNPSLVLWFPTFSSPTLGKFYPMATSVMRNQGKTHVFGHWIWTMGQHCQWCHQESGRHSWCHVGNQHSGNSSRSNLTQIGMQVPPSCHIKRPLWCNDLSPIRQLFSCSPCNQGLITT